MRMFRALVTVLWVMGLAPLAFAAETNSPGKTINIPVKPQPWQVKRAEFLMIVSAVLSSKGKDAQAQAKLNAFLAKLKQNPLSITPMEAMDVYGVHFVPREGATEMKLLLMMISSYATLGWYDTLRYASPSGRAEILGNEKFLSRPFVLSGTKGRTYLKDYLDANPEEAHLAVLDGTRIARRVRNRERRDQDWPTAYGLERMMCAMNGKSDCPKPQALPKEKWDDAFEEAVAKVEKYYRASSKE